MLSESKVETRNSKLKADPPSAGEFRVSSFEFRTPVCRWIVAAAAAFVTVGNATAARAQSCAMCYNTAAAAKATAIQALRSGILILLVPVALMFIGIFILAFRSKERCSEPSPEEIDDNRELSNWLESLPRTVSQ